MGTAIMKYPVPERVKPSFVIFDIRHSDAQGLSVRVPGVNKGLTTKVHSRRQYRHSTLLVIVLIKNLNTDTSSAG